METANDQASIDVEMKSRRDLPHPWANVSTGECVVLTRDFKDTWSILRCSPRRQQIWKIQISTATPLEWSMKINRLVLEFGPLSTILCTKDLFVPLVENKSWEPECPLCLYLSVSRTLHCKCWGSMVLYIVDALYIFTLNGKFYFSLNYIPTYFLLTYT